MKKLEGRQWNMPVPCRMHITLFSNCQRGTTHEWEKVDFCYLGDKSNALQLREQLSRIRQFSFSMKLPPLWIPPYGALYPTSFSPIVPHLFLISQKFPILPSNFQSERLVQEALEAASKSRTTICIAHRLSTIKNADNIIVMSHGTIIEQGTDDQLYNSDGMYKGLVDAQRIS